MFNRVVLTFLALTISSPGLAGTTICEATECVLIGNMPATLRSATDGAVRVTFSQGQLTIDDTVYADFALPGGAQLVVGDWDGDGLDEPGAYGGGYWILQTGWALSAPQRLIDMTALGHSRKAKPLVGSWKGAASDGIGLYDNGVFTLYSDYNDVSAPLVIDFGNVPNDIRTPWEAMPFAGPFERGMDGVGLSKGVIVAYAPHNVGATYDFLGGDPALVGATLPFRGFGAFGRARPYLLDLSRLGTGESGHILAYRLLPTATPADREECYTNEDYYCVNLSEPLDEGTIVVPFGHTW